MAVQLKNCLWFHLLIMFNIFVTICSIGAAQSGDSSQCTEIMWGVRNRDGDKTTFPLKEDLRLKTFNIVKAHEILRKGLQQFLEFKEKDLGTYLHRINEKNNNATTYFDEYGQEIPSYYDIFYSIWEQHKEILCENYAIQQFDKDKLDLCSLARFLSHQPLVEDRETLMKRMGDALGYRCHPCIPYKPTKQYDETFNFPTHITEKIGTDGISLEESSVHCKGDSMLTGLTTITERSPTDEAEVALLRSNLSITIRDRMYASIKEYGSNKVVTDAWDLTQSKLYCCGVEGYDGWRTWVAEIPNLFNMRILSAPAVPLSCCQKIQNSGQGGNNGFVNSGQSSYDEESFMQCQSNPNSNTAYLTGCLHKAVEAVIDKTAVVDEVGMGISFIVQ